MTLRERYDWTPGQHQDLKMEKALIERMCLVSAVGRPFAFRMHLTVQ